MRTLLIITGALVCLSGCSDDGGCTTDSDCDTGFVCEESICVQEIDDVTMMEVAAGPFMMGCNEAEDTACDPDELPYHEVTLSTYEIDVREVTQARYQACVDVGGCSAPGTDASCNWDPVGRADHPVGCVSWDQANVYCTYVGKRLPSEAEWEKAARGATGLVYPWGNSAPDCLKANFGDCLGDSAPVGSHTEGNSPYGAEDMAGNLYEWVNDYYAVAYYESSPSDDPTGPTSGDNRVMRGGAFGYEIQYMRASNRGANPQTASFSPLGFRCAK